MKKLFLKSCAQGDTEMVAELLALHTLFQTPLHPQTYACATALCARQGHKECTALLLPLVRDINTYACPLLIAAVDGGNLCVLKSVLQYIHPSHMRCYALRKAAATHNDDMIDYLLKEGRVTAEQAIAHACTPRTAIRLHQHLAWSPLRRAWCTAVFQAPTNNAQTCLETAPRAP